MRKIKLDKKKLSLNARAIRKLNAENLADVKGGDILYTYLSCHTCHSYCNC
jgi:hypothetical protein